VEWFWREAALAKLRRQTSQAGERAQSFARRARVTADEANVTHTSEPWEPLREAIASELYRQSAYWAACALSEDPSSGIPSTDAGPPWEALEDRLFNPPEGGVATPDALRQLARTGSFTYFAELSRDELRRARLSLRWLARALLARFDERLAPLKAIRAQRYRRLGLLVVLLLGAALGATWVREVRLRRTELSAGKSWRLSSSYGTGGCTSPEQKCPENTGFFFHTRVNDHNPWIEFDLATPQQVSIVEVENRQDCCFERALPLAVEISRDHKSWQEVARRDADFSTWRASFDAVQARWVRLRIPQPGTLHLHAVRIYP